MKWLFSIILCVFACNYCRAQTNTLDQYLNYAITNSPLLKDLKTQLLFNQIDSLRLRAGYRVQVTANSNGLYAPTKNGYGYASAITNEHTLAALVSVNKQLVTKKQLKYALASISLHGDSINNVSRLSEQDLKKTITGQYITAYGSLQQVKFDREIIALLTNEEGLLKKLTRENVYRQSDYLTFLVTLKQQQLQLLQAIMQYKNDHATLNYLAGIADTSLIELQVPDIQRLPTPDLNNSIFFRQYQIDSLRSVNTRALVDLSYKTRTNVFVDGGYNSDFMGQPYKNFGASVGFNLTLPIYDGGMRKLAYKRLYLEEESRLNYKAFFNMQYRQQVQQLEQQIKENDNLVAQINEEIKYSESLIKADTKLLQTGDVKIADLILAINNYLTIKELLTQTTITKLQLISELNYWKR